MFFRPFNLKLLFLSVKRTVCSKSDVSLGYRLCFNNFSSQTNLFKNQSCTSRHCILKRYYHDERKPNQKFSTTVYYLSAVGVLTLGLTYAAVPLYRIFCQASGYGGTVIENVDTDVSQLRKVKHKEIRVEFNADVSSNLKWKFRPQQNEITVIPGETALAFYTAENPSDKPIVGVSTYNVVPFEAGQYFNKIQCFCFEEQMLNPHEQVDMPVFFYIDPEFSEDPKMEYVSNIILSYTFFEVKDGMNLPIPGYYQPHKR